MMRPLTLVGALVGGTSAYSNPPAAALEPEYGPVVQTIADDGHTHRERCFVRALHGHPDYWDAIYTVSDQAFLDGMDRCPERPYRGLHCMPESALNSNFTTCTTAKANDGSYRISHMVGPITTTGGFSWTEIDFTTELTDALNEAGETPPGTEWIVSAVAFTFHKGIPPTDGTAGEEMGLPPLHDHHFGYSVGFDENRLGGVSFPGNGDIYCPNQKDGFECNARTFMDAGYYVLINESSRTHGGGIFNDVRDADSPAMTWYLNITLSIISRDTVAERQLQPVERVQAMHSYEQHTPFGTVSAPHDRESYLVAQGRWNFTGGLVTDGRLSNFHAHMPMVNQSFLIAGSARELGLDDPRFYSSDGCTVRTTKDSGFKDNKELREYLVGYCPHCFDRYNSSNADLSLRPRLICMADAAYAEVGDYVYDRRPWLQCAQPLTPVEEGDVYTIVSFLGPKNWTTYTEGKSSANYVFGGGNYLREGYSPSHTHYLMYGVVAPGSSLAHDGSHYNALWGGDDLVFDSHYCGADDDVRNASNGKAISVPH